MRKIIICLFVSFLSISCKAQEINKDTKWNTGSFEDSGFSVNSPCELKRTFFKSFQEKPRPIRVFSYECESVGIKYLASLKEHMDEFDEKRVPQQLKSTEEYLPTLFKEKNLEVVFKKTEDVTKYGFPVRIFDAEIGNKDRWREHTLVNSKGVFSLTAVMIIPKEKVKTEKMESDFIKNAQKFFDSFQLK